MRRFHVTAPSSRRHEREEALPGIKLDNRQPVVPQVYRLLRRDIVSARLLPGLRLSEKEVSDQMGTSRQPVREAFIKLAEDGLVEIRPQRGTFVSKISVKAVKDTRFVREALELAILDEIRNRFPDGFDGASQRGIIDGQRAAAARGDVEAFFVLDEAFHKGFTESVGREHAWKVIENDKAQWDRVRFLTMPRVSPMASLARQHELVVECLEGREWEAARTALRAHLREALATLPAVAAEHPGLFEGVGDPAG